MENIYRDMFTAEVNEKHVGKEIKLAGWVENMRDDGGILFVDLRDQTGIVQLVANEDTLFKGVTKHKNCFKLL